MSVVAAIAPIAVTINATLPPPLVAFVDPPPSDIDIVTVPPPGPPSPPAPRHSAAAAAHRRRPGRRTVSFWTDRRREARIYSWGSRSFLTANRSSRNVSVNRHGNSVYGN